LEEEGHTLKAIVEPSVEELPVLAEMMTEDEQ
jgi:hypothetical protein